MSKRTATLVLALLFGLPGVVSAAPTIGVPTATPASIPVRTSTPVTVSAEIADPTLLPESVNLLRLDASGKTLAILGRLRDDGLDGDAAAGDKRFTLRLTFSEPSATRIYLKISAGFRGMLRRVLSETATVEVTSAPGIADFSPKSAVVGTLVTVAGSGFAPAPGVIPRISVNKQGGGTLEASVSEFSATALSFVLPAGAASGPITVTVGAQSAASAVPLVIVPPADAAISVAPTASSVLRGQSVSYVVSLSSVASASGFSQLAALSIRGLPPGVTATFTPPQITAGQRSILTITAPDGQPLGASDLAVTASAVVDGIPIQRSAPATLNVLPVTTSFIGRTVVDDPLQTPIAGVTVRFLGVDGFGRPTGCTHTTVSDAAGNFAFTNLPAECTGYQLIQFDGLTATAPEGKYAGVDLRFLIENGRVNVSPVLIHLPRIDNAERVMVAQNAAVDQTFTFASIPNLSVTVYAGTTFTLADGTQPNPFPLIAVQVPVDRLPDEMPPMNGINAFIVAFQPANAKASQPVAVSFPNTLKNTPGTNMDLFTLDPTRGVMVKYGTGTASANGTQILPDADPQRPGHRYGLVNFDWHGPVPPPPPNPVNPSPQPTSGCDSAPTTPNPVHLSSGVETVTATDMVLSGARGTVAIVRNYRTFTNTAGPFGIGTSHNFGYRLNTLTPQNLAVVNLIMPDGNQFPFTRQADGTLVNATIPQVRGAVLRVSSDGQADLRWKEGTVFHFVPANFPLGSVLTSITDRNGNRITLTRDSGNPARILRITDPVNRSLSLLYDGSDRIVAITDPIGRMVRYTYNAVGTLQTVTNPEGGVTRYDYEVLGNQIRLIRETDTRGVVVARNTYDDFGRVIAQQQADGGTIRIEYRLFNPNVPTSPVNETIVTDPLNRKTKYRFNPEGFLIDTTDVSGQTRMLEREPGTNLLLTSCGSCSASSGEDYHYTYDASGNMRTVTDPLGNTTSYTYDPVFSNVTSITDPLGRVTRFTYDARGNLLTSTDANGKQTSFVYNSFGQMTQIIDALNQRTLFTYDSAGNLTSVTDALGNRGSIAYDAVSRPVQIMDALGRTSSTAYDALDRVVRQTNANNEMAQFTYDQVGNLRTVTDALNRTTGFAYDGMNRLVTRMTPLGATDTREYDFLGNLTAFVDRRGQRSFFDYDGLDRLIRERYQDGSVVLRTYDVNDRLLHVEDSAGGAFSFAYDLNGRLTGSVSPFGAVQYAYDAAGQMTARQVVGQPTVQYGYDLAGNLLRAAMPQAAVAFAYSDRNEILRVTRSNNVASQYLYDEVGRLRSLSHGGPAGAIFSQSYNYDSVGRRTGSTVSHAQPLITQPVVNQYDAANRLIQSGNTTFSYDDNGNLTGESGPNGATTYTWDTRNRLVSIARAGGQATTFLYDFAGNMIAQRDAGPSLNVVKTFVLDDLTNVVSQNSSTGSQFAILTGQEIDDHFAVVRPGNQAEFGLTDALNSMVTTVDQGGGIKARFSYEPYGQAAPSGDNYPFQYTGRVPMSGSLYYYRARYYNPMVERFVSEDPIGFAGGMNLYAYVGNDPINRVDPLGLRCFDFWESAWSRFTTTNDVLWGWAAPPLTGAVAGGLLSIFSPNHMRTHTFFSGMRYLYNGLKIGLGTQWALGTAPSVLGSIAVTMGAVAISYEFGVGVGSIIGAGFDWLTTPDSPCGCP